MNNRFFRRMYKNIKKERIMSETKIVVCIKHVGCIYHPTAVDLSTGEIDPEKMVYMPNPYDECAVEAALQIKEAYEDCKISLVSVGDTTAEQTLRYAYAMGGDRIDQVIRIHCDNYQHMDAMKTSRMLSNVIERIGFDVILCGKKALDTNGCQVGTYIAENLSLPEVSSVVGLSVFFEKNQVVAERYMGKGDRQEVECILPGLFSVEIGLNDPRYPTLKNRLFANKKAIEVIDPVAEDLISKDTPLTRMEKFSFPRPKTRKVFAPDSNLSPLERMNAMLSGGGGGKKSGSSVLEGDDDKLAGYVIEFLTQNKILGTNR